MPSAMYELSASDERITSSSLTVAVHEPVDWQPVLSEVDLIPTAYIPGQEYYWSRDWQADEWESRAELASGGGIRFETAEDVIRWLMRSDEE